MDSGIPATGALAATGAQTECYHCGLPQPRDVHYTIEIDGIERALCCAGCKAVAQIIVDHGLTSYYRHRSALPVREGTVPPAVRGLGAYDVPAVERALTRDAGNHGRTVALMLSGITCAACVWLIEQRIARLPGVLGIDINFATHRAQVRWDTRRTRLAAILEAIAALGYRADPYDCVRAEQARASERDGALARLFVAGFGMMQVMMYLVPVYLTNGEMTADIEQLMRIASLTLTLPVVLFAATPFFAGAWRDVRARHLGMDVPVALGIGAAFAASVAATLGGGGPVYYDSVTMFVFLLLAARYLEMTARARAAMTQEQLAQQAPAVAERYAAWPGSDLAEVVAAVSLRVGDYLRVRAGALIPVDGVVADGASEVDERLLTGESRPQPKRAGDAVTGGSLNVGNPLVIRVARVGADTVLAGVLRLLDRAAAEKPRIARVADAVAQWFVLALLVIAAIVAMVWYQLDAGRALWVTVAVLVVSCPCALSLATPAALAAANGALHAHGVLITRGNALESLARATHFVFDKTGTLTTGIMRLVGVIPLGGGTREQCLALAAALESGSGHPIARALAAAAPESPRYRCSDLNSSAGNGVAAMVEAKHVRLGAPQFVAALHGQPLPRELTFVADDVTTVALGDERGWIALFTLDDPVRPQARRVIRELVRMGKEVHLLSGDRPQIARHVAQALGIPAVQGGATPRDKLDYVQRLQRNGAVVAMVGDGINDVAGLAVAQVSIAMGCGTDIACGASDVILLAGRLDALLTAVRTAQGTLRVIHQNLAWAFAYNVVAVPLAACGYVTPLIAGAGMAASSLLVVANALRLLRPVPVRADAALAVPAIDAR